MPVFIVEVWNIDEDIEDVRANIVSILIGQFLIIMADVQLSDKVKEIRLFNFGVVCEVIE